MRLVICLIPFLLVFNGLALGQERFLMDQNTFQKFKQAKRMYEKGEQLFFKGKLSEAEEVLEKCVAVFPKYSQAYFILAQVNYKQKEFPTAWIIYLAPRHISSICPTSGCPRKWSISLPCVIEARS